MGQQLSFALTSPDASAAPVLLPPWLRGSKKHAPPPAVRTASEAERAVLATLQDWRRWPEAQLQMTQHPALVASGILCALPKATGASARSLRAALRALPAAALDAAAASLSAGVQSWLASWQSGPAGQDELPRRAPKLPRDWSLTTVEAPRLRSGRPLTRADLRELVIFLSACPPLRPHPALERVKALCTAPSLDRFVWSLVSCWEAAGGRPQHDWALWACMSLGGPVSIRGLMGRAARWPQQGAAERAHRVPVVLWGIRSPLALTYLHRLSQRSPSTTVRCLSEAALSALAASEGHSPDRLLAEHAPQLGFSTSRDRTITTGGCRVVLRVVSAPEGGLTLRSVGHANLDLTRSPSWNALSGDLQVLSSAMVHRLEQMMCSGAYWSPETFQAYAAHPLYRLMMERVLWCAVDDSGQIVGRVLPGDRQLASGAPLPDGARIGPPHPMCLAPRLRERWQQTLPSPLFEQLSRPVYEMDAKEAAAASLSRYQGAEVDQGWLFARLRQGWSWGTVGKGSVLRGMCFPIPGAQGAVAHLQLLPGIKRGQRQTQRLGRVTASRGGSAIALGELGTIGFSELVAAIADLVSGRC